jgi:hypothetical protein
MKEIIRALKNHEVDADSIVQEIELGDANAALHIFGKDGYHFCKHELIVTWLSFVSPFGIVRKRHRPMDR